VGAATTAYTYPTTNHRLTQVGTNARTYDNAGNATQIAGTVQKNFVYGDHNRMTQYKEGTTAKMNYVYNGKGEQVRKYISTTNTYSLYDEAGHWLADYTNATTPVQQVIWMGDLPVGVLVGSGANQKLHYIEPDALGTPRVVVDPTRGANGTAVWNWDLAGEAFGTTAPNQNPDGDANQFVFNMRFPGQRFDSASGLNYNYFRDYDPSTGRYVQSDPIGWGGGVSTYGYVGANPATSVDPLGLAFTTIDAYCSKNPSACAGVISRQPNIAPASLGTGFVAITWCWVADCIVLNNAYSPVPDYQLTSLERRAKSRYCNDQPDPCESLKQATRQAIIMAQVKMNAMLNDDKSMFGTIGWTTHGNDLQGRLNSIAAMISLGTQSGCDMSQEIALAATLYLPSAPL
jgi:RHS repeat-associated protein